MIRKQILKKKKNSNTRLEEKAKNNLNKFVAEHKILGQYIKLSPLLLDKSSSSSHIISRITKFSHFQFLHLSIYHANFKALPSASLELCQMHNFDMFKFKRKQLSSHWHQEVTEVIVQKNIVIISANVCWTELRQLPALTILMS